MTKGKEMIVKEEDFWHKSGELSIFWFSFVDFWNDPNC